MKIPEFYIVLVEPKYSGNVGAVARAMANFDYKKLYLINPCELDDECYARSKHAYNLIDNAKIFKSFNEIKNKLDYLVATSSIENKKDKKHLRNPVLLNDFSKEIYNVEGKIGLIFGREDYGLFNEEIAQCDIMLKIPTSENYKSLNLSHAVCLVLYSLYFNNNYQPKEKRQIGDIEKEKLYIYFSKLLDEIDYPNHKKEKTEIMFRRLIGRAIPSKWEFHRLMGVISKTLNKIKK